VCSVCCSPCWLGGAAEDVKQGGQQSVGRNQKERRRSHPSGAGSIVVADRYGGDVVERLLA